MRRGLSLLVTVVLLSTALVDFASPRSRCGSHACCLRSSGCSMMQQGSRFASCDSDGQAIQHEDTAILTLEVTAPPTLSDAGEGAGAPLNPRAGVTQDIERPPNT